MYSIWSNGMVEYWNVVLNKELAYFIASLSRQILPIYDYPIFLDPLFHYSTIPTFQLRSEAN
jgi:hypothetical protein